MQAAGNNAVTACPQKGLNSVSSAISSRVAITMVAVAPLAAQSSNPVVEGSISVEMPPPMQR